MRILLATTTDLWHLAVWVSDTPKPAQVNTAPNTRRRITTTRTRLLYRCIDCGCCQYVCKPCSESHCINDVYISDGSLFSTGSIPDRLHSILCLVLELMLGISLLKNKKKLLPSGPPPCSCKSMYRLAWRVCVQQSILHRCTANASQLHLERLQAIAVQHLEALVGADHELAFKELLGTFAQMSVRHFYLSFLLTTHGYLVFLQTS